MTKLAWKVIHHAVAHPLIGLSIGRLWAWRFHDYTWRRAWPGEEHAPNRETFELTTEKRAQDTRAFLDSWDEVRELAVEVCEVAALYVTTGA